MDFPNEVCGYNTYHNMMLPKPCSFLLARRPGLQFCSGHQFSGGVHFSHLAKMDPVDACVLYITSIVPEGDVSSSVEDLPATSGDHVPDITTRRPVLPVVAFAID